MMANRHRPAEGGVATRRPGLRDGGFGVMTGVTPDRMMARGRFCCVGSAGLPRSRGHMMRRGAMVVLRGDRPRRRRSGQDQQ
jgi:hypothetical protein